MKKILLIFGILISTEANARFIPSEFFEQNCETVLVSTTKEHISVSCNEESILYKDDEKNHFITTFGSEYADSYRTLTPLEIRNNIFNIFRNTSYDLDPTKSTTESRYFRKNLQIEAFLKRIRDDKQIQSITVTYENIFLYDSNGLITLPQFVKHQVFINEEEVPMIDVQTQVQPIPENDYLFEGISPLDLRAFDLIFQDFEKTYERRISKKVGSKYIRKFSQRNS